MATYWEITYGMFSLCQFSVFLFQFNLGFWSRTIDLMAQFPDIYILYTRTTTGVQNDNVILSYDSYKMY